MPSPAPRIRPQPGPKPDYIIKPAGRVANGSHAPATKGAWSDLDHQGTVVKASCNEPLSSMSSSSSSGGGSRTTRAEVPGVRADVPVIREKSSNTGIPVKKVRNSVSMENENLRRGAKLDKLTGSAGGSVEAGRKERILETAATRARLEQTGGDRTALSGSKLARTGSLNYRNGSPATGNGKFIERSVSPQNFSNVSRLKTPGSNLPKARVGGGGGGIPVRSGGGATRASSTGDTTPRSSTSKESTPSPVHSPRTSAIFSASSSSQEDLVKNVQLRSYKRTQGLLPRSQSSSIRQPLPELSPPHHNARLLGANSVEVLSECSQSKHSPPKHALDNKLGQSLVALRPNPPPKPSALRGGSKIPPPSSSSSSGGRRTPSTPSYSTPRTKTSGGGSSPRSRRAQDKSSSAKSHPSFRTNPPGGHQSPKLNRTGSKPQSSTAKPVSSLDAKYGQKGMIGGQAAEQTKGNKTKRKQLKSEAEKVLKEQLSRGKLPPKAKFRADDEISIGDPSEARGTTTTTSTDAGLTERRPAAEGAGGQEIPPPSPTTASDTPVDRDSPDRRILSAETVNSPVRGVPTEGSPVSRGLSSKSVINKSASLDHHYRRPEVPGSKQPRLLSVKSSSTNFFQRISSLRQSFNDRRSPSKITPHTTNSDAGFFQGISGRPKYLLATYEHHHGPYLILPPLVKPPPKATAQQRKRSRRHLPLPSGRYKRSFSFTDAQFIAQAVTEGDVKAIEEVYPGFPLSEKLYPVIKTRKQADPAAEPEKMVKPRFLTDYDRVGPTAVLGRQNSSHISNNNNNNNGTVTDTDESGSAEKVPGTPCINFYSPQDPSPIISPWSRTSGSSLVRSSSSAAASSCSPSATTTLPSTPVKPDNVNLLECNGNLEQELVNGVGIGANHPFIQRVYGHQQLSSSCRGSWNTSVSVSPSKFGANGQLVISTSVGGAREEEEDRREVVGGGEDPFQNIISLADSNISQAESILSSLGCERSGVLSDADTPTAGGLSSDIESNIRKLERTQAKINAALETFRSVHQFHHHHQHHQIQLHGSGGGVGHAVSSPRLTGPSTIDNAELYTSFPLSLGNRRDSRHRVTYPQSKAELKANSRKLSFEPPPVSSELASSEAKPRKTSLFRRHSFNHSYKDKVTAKTAEPSIGGAVNATERDSSVWGGGGGAESDIDSARSSAIYDDCAFSDSEGGFSPLKNRIRGLLGSFGKGKKKLVKAPKRKTDPIVSMKDPVDGGEDRTDMSESLSIGQFTELVKSLPANSFSAKDSTKSSNADTLSLLHSPATFLRPKNPKPHKAVVQHNSNDTFSSVSTNQSLNASSNRNSVISAQSISSESYDNDNNSASDENGTSTSSPQASNNDDLSPEQRQERKLFFIAREIMTSEKVYVDVLRLLNSEFREFVQKARQESKSGILPDQEFVKLFSNLPELMMLNEDLLRDFEERIENWHKVKKIADVIVKKGPYLKLYTVYIRDFSAMNFHFEECCSRYTKFGKLVKEFEKLPRCQHLKLQHFMLKPVQRLPQYRLLLEDYLKHLDPDSEDFDDTTHALHIVSEAAEHANNTVKQGDKFQRMLRLQSRLGDWELIKPGRELIKEGELHKISRKGVGSRYFILLSDCLLYTSYQGAWAGDSTSLKVTYAIMLNQLQVNLSSCQDREYSTEFSITSNVRSCTLRAKDVKERNDWLDALNTAIEDYRSRKATFLTSESLTVSSNEGHLGEAAPVWVPDQRVTMCQMCGAEFNLVQRRHHCRACGKVICTTCSKNKAPLRYKRWESHRVCDSCYDSLEKQHGQDEDLRSRFKKRDHSRAVNKYIPQRLKLSANSEGSQMSGHLRRRGKHGKWKRSWYVLKERVLYTYRASEDTVAAETLPVLGWSLQPLSNATDLPEGASPELTFQLIHPGSETLMFVAENPELTDKWKAELLSSTTL